jgi:hypothetical protein
MMWILAIQMYLVLLEQGLHVWKMMSSQNNISVKVHPGHTTVNWTQGMATLNVYLLRKNVHLLLMYMEIHNNSRGQLKGLLDI